eukprot:scaffold2816_cov121-Cylindrotheca_fusiformis.AAC.6
MERLKEENEYLKAEVYQLKRELAQRDHLIATMESQINVLEILRHQSVISTTPSEDDGGAYAINSTSSSSDEDNNNNNNGLRRRRRATHEDSTLSVPLEPPRRSWDLVPTLIRHDDILESGIGTKLESKIMEESEDGDSSDSYGDHNRRVVQQSKGAIKALPRELSIINSDSDDVTKYSVTSGIFKLERAEMRDAYNARGLYTGTISRKEQMPHGKGRMDYHLQGRFYEGDWNMGHWHGFGVIRNAQGDFYRGKVVNDLREGRGRLEYADGRVFEGTFKADDAVQGTLTFPDGGKYIGALNDGKRHGIGIYYFADGSRYEGESVNNFFEGKGKMIWEDGGYYEGEWAQGEIDGYGKEIRPDGSVRHEGLWSNGFPVRD